MPYTRVNDVTLHYTDEGAGLPVLLVHGWTCDSNDWIWQIPALLDAGYRVIAVDLRGHGRSEVTEDGYNVRQMARDCAALLEGLEAAPAIVMGHSMGGAIAVAMAVEHPAAVRAIISVDAAYGLPAELGPLVTEILEGLRGPDWQAAAAVLFARFYQPASPPHLPTWHQRRAFSMPPHVVAKAMEGIMAVPDQFALEPASLPYLRQVRVPVFTVRVGEGALQSVIDEAARFPQAAHAGKGFPENGHWPHQEDPASFNQAMLAWTRAL